MFNQSINHHHHHHENAKKIYTKLLSLNDSHNKNDS